MKAVFVWAITLWQPWASLIAAGVKTTETRDWAPPAALIGQRIAIHAAKRPITRTDITSWPRLLVRAVRRLVEALGPPPGPAATLEDLPLGAVVATARLVDCGWVLKVNGPDSGGPNGVADEYVNTATVRCPERMRYVPLDDLGDYSMGRYVWFLEDIQPVDPPVPARGRQKFWKWEPPATLLPPDKEES